MTDLATIQTPRAAAVSQATAVEQSRAVAEVQAAIYVAQQFPRDAALAYQQMRDACSRSALAGRAFYAVPNRGSGPSVHLAREMARIWGNLDYGVRELRRDDAAGESEVQAYAWDQQTNTRSSRSFIHPHARMKKVGGKNTREALTDLTDIYLSNQNVGARAVRECIASVLPTEFFEEAQDRCRETLNRGDGKPLDQRITDMVAAFRQLGVTVAQMESRIGRKRGQWTGADVAQMLIAHSSITKEGVPVADIFDVQRVTVAEIVAQTPAVPPDATSRPRLVALFESRHFVDDLDRRAFSEQVLDIPGDTLAHLDDLTDRQVAAVTAALEALDA